MTRHTDRMTPDPARHTVTGPPPRPAAHFARPPMPPAHLLATTAAAAIVLALIGLGLWALLASGGPATSTPTSAQLITVTPSAHP